MTVFDPMIPVSNCLSTACSKGGDEGGSKRGDERASKRGDERASKGGDRREVTDQHLLIERCASWH